MRHRPRHGMVHRDIKPGNLILLTGEREAGGQKSSTSAWPRRPDVVDASLTGARHLLGTPDFVAPEQIQRAKTVDIRGRHLQSRLYPTTAHGPPAVCRRHHHAAAHGPADRPARPVIRHRPDIPVELVAILDTMLAEPGRSVRHARRGRPGPGPVRGGQPKQPD